MQHGKPILWPQTSHAFLVGDETYEDQSEVCCLHSRSYKDTTMSFYKDTLQQKTTTERWDPVIQSCQITQVTIILIPDFT